MFGLTPSEIEIIINVFKSRPLIDEAIIFGSRSMGKNKKGSDIDIALKGAHIEAAVTDVSGLLNEESPLPYFFDILDYNQITNLELKNHIDRVGKTFYRKSS